MHFEPNGKWEIEKQRNRNSHTFGSQLIPKYRKNKKQRLKSEGSSI